MYICYRKTINGWAIGYIHRKHNPEADKLRANRGAAKELQIRGKYEAKLAALNIFFSSTKALVIISIRYTARP